MLFFQKTILEPNHIRNFCPGSNLPFLRKIVEKVVVMQLQKVLDEVDCLDPFQFEFRPRISLRQHCLYLLKTFGGLQLGWCNCPSSPGSPGSFKYYYGKLWYPSGPALGVGNGRHRFVVFLLLSPWLVPGSDGG